MILTLEVPDDIAADIQREAAAWGTTVEAHALTWLVAARDGDPFVNGQTFHAAVDRIHSGRSLPVPLGNPPRTACGAFGHMLGPHHPRWPDGVNCPECMEVLSWRAHGLPF